MTKTSRGMTIYSSLLTMTLLFSACGGAGTEPDGAGNAGDQTESGGGGAESDGPGGGGDSGGAGAGQEGDSAALRLAPAGWENACTVLSNDEVAAATGFTVLEAREAGGCDWMIEPVDDSTRGADVFISWYPVTSRQFDIQQESAPLAGSDTVVEPIEGLGRQAFWLGNTVNELGEIWVQTDQLGFRVSNQFATVGYAGDTRQPMEALASALAASLSGMDVIAASGEAGQALIPPDRVDLPEGIPTTDSLIPELSAIPLPTDTVFGSGGVYPDRASQDIYLDLSVGDTARFFLEALPTAGFEIVSGGVETVDEVLEYSAMTIAFLDPTGQRGDVIIREGAFAPSQVGLQIFLSG